MSDIPLCKDCKHAVTYYPEICFSCGISVSPVTGKKGTLDCIIARSPGYPCGLEGKLFEQKPEENDLEHEMAYG